MINLPSDLFFLFVIRMDIEMIESILDEDDLFLGMQSAEFVRFLKDKMDDHKKLGDTTLLALPGRYKENQKLAYSFLGNKSKEPMGFVIAVNDRKEMLSFHYQEDFVFDDFPFHIDSL